MDPTRFILIYIIHVSAAFLLLIIVYKVLKRNPKNRFNQIFSLFFFSNIISIVNNCFYAPISDPALEGLVSYLHLLSIYLLILSTGFILLCLFLMYYPEKMIQLKNQLIFILIYGGLVSIMFLIPNSATIEISADGNQGSPQWNFNLFLFIIIFSSVSLMLTFILSLKIYKQFENKAIRKKFILFIIGIIILFYNPYSIAIGHYLEPSVLRDFFLLSGIFSFPGFFLLYLGIGTEVQRTGSQINEIVG